MQQLVRMFWGVDPPNQGVPPTPTEPYLAFLRREADCSLTRLTFDDQRPAPCKLFGLSGFRPRASRPTADSAHSRGAALTTMTGTASQVAAYLGPTANGNHAAVLRRTTRRWRRARIAELRLRGRLDARVVAQNAGASVNLASADLDADGNNDVVLATVLYTGPSQTGRLSVFRGRERRHARGAANDQSELRRSTASRSTT